MRFGKQAKEAWGEEYSTEVDQLLARVADILDEMTRGVTEGTEKSSKQFEEQYAFIYRELASCRINQDADKLDSCLKLLEFERETWALACKKYEADSATPGLPGTPHLHLDAMPTSDGLSLEA